MHPLGIVLVVAGLLQAVGAITRSRVFKALPHFKKSERLFGEKWALVLHAVIGGIAAIAGVLILVGLVEIPD